MKKQSELTVITKAKNLCSYVMLATQKSPKHFRYTFISRLQNLSLDIIEKLFRANDVYFTKEDTEAQKLRLELQREAMTELRLLGYIGYLAMQQQCILAKQYEEMSSQIMDCQNLLGAWMNSDKKRLQS